MNENTPPSNGFPDIMLDESAILEKQAPSSATDISEIYKHLGFHGAIREYGNQVELDRILHESTAQITSKKENIDTRFRRRLDWHESQLKDLEARLLQERDDKGTLKRLEEIRHELLETYRLLGEEKRNLIEKRLDEFSIEIKKLFDTENTLYDDWRQLNKKAFDDNKNLLEVKKKRAEELKNNFERREKDVNLQILTMERSGIDNAAVKFLLGKAMALAAGWFFSVYLILLNAPQSSQGSFSQQDVWFFLLKSILHSLSNNPLYAILQVIAFILIIGISAYISQYLMRFLDPEKNTQDIVLVFADQDNSNGDELFDKISKGFKFKFTSDSIYALFLQIVPVLVTMGLVFVVLRLGFKDDIIIDAELEKLDASIAGQIIGTAIAFAFAGFLLIFISKIKDMTEEKFPNFSDVHWGNYVMVVTVMLFPLLFLLPIPHDVRAIIGFIFTVLLAGTTIAFGIRYRGLLKIANDLLASINICTRIIANFSTPFPVGVHSKDFRLKVRKMQDELIDWINGKNIAVRDMQGIQANTLDTGKKSSLFRRSIDWVLGRNNKKRHFNMDEKETTRQKNNFGGFLSSDDDIKYRIHDLELDAFEKQNFPNYDKKITAAKYEYDEIRLENKTASKRIKELEYQIEDVTGKIFTLEGNRDNVSNNIGLQGLRQQTWIQEGFELGLWYINNLFPERDPHIANALSKNQYGSEKDDKVTLKLTIEEDFNEYKVSHLGRLLEHIKGIIGGDYGQPNFIGVEKGSVKAILELKHCQVKKLIAFITQEDIGNYRIVSIDSYKDGRMIDSHLEEITEENELKRIKDFLNESIVENIDLGIKELKKTLDSSNAKYKEFSFLETRLNSLNRKKWNGTLNYKDSTEEENKILKSLFDFLDDITIEDIKKNRDKNNQHLLDQ